jgi:hypothetical protein
MQIIPGVICICLLSEIALSKSKIAANFIDVDCLLNDAPFFLYLVA